MLACRGTCTTIEAVADTRVLLMLGACREKVTIRPEEASRGFRHLRTRARIDLMLSNSSSCPVLERCYHQQVLAKTSSRTSLIPTRMKFQLSWALKTQSCSRRKSMGKVPTSWEQMKRRSRASGKILNSSPRSSSLIPTAISLMPNSNRFFSNRALEYPSVNSLGYLFIELKSSWTTRAPRWT